MALPHFAVKELHPQTFAPLCPGVKLSRCAQKARVLADLNGKGKARLPTFDHLEHPVLAGMRDDETLWLQLVNGVGQRLGERGWRLGRIGAAVDKPHARFLQRLGKVPHRRKYENELFLVMRNIAKL